MLCTPLFVFFEWRSRKRRRVRHGRDGSSPRIHTADETAVTTHPLPSRYHTLHGDMRLFILIVYCSIGITRSSRCMYQVRTRTVQSGGSVTIPCSYSSSEESDKDVEIGWWETHEEYCSSDNSRIFSSSGEPVGRYQGRFYSEKDPNRNRTEYINITRLQSSDGPRICCKLFNIKHETPSSWSTLGTLLQFSDTEHVTQPDEVMAVSSEEVLIPCYYFGDTSSLRYSSWSITDSATSYCSNTNPILESNQEHQHNRYSLVNYSQDISLRIRNIQSYDQRSYCCTVSTGQRKIYSKQSTRLVIADYRSSWNHPDKVLTVPEGQPVTLTCSYTLPSDRYTERDIMRVNVYWRVGNVTGPYAYHPYREMVHSTYKHRAYITGVTDLMIKNVTKIDNTSFHCFVVIKLCAGDNYYEDKIQYGGGTRLTFSGKEERTPKEELPLALIIAVSCVAVLIILVMILIILKLKGVICKKKNSFSEQQLNTVKAAGDGTTEETPYCEISTKKAEEIPQAGNDESGKSEIENGQMEDGHLLYAQLNKSKLKDHRPAETPKTNEEVIYAAVVKTTTD